MPRISSVRRNHIPHRRAPKYSVRIFEMCSKKRWRPRGDTPSGDPRKTIELFGGISACLAREVPLKLVA